MSSLFKVQRLKFNSWLLMAALLRCATAFAATEGTNAPAPINATPKTNAVLSTDFKSFKIISDRNIFSSSRSGRVSRSGPVVKPKKIESFTLVGTVDYAKGLFAIFDGSSSSFSKSVKIGETFAGFTIKDISLDQVTISNGTNIIPLRVGSTLRREDEGEWHSGSGVAPSIAKAEPSSSDSKSSNADADTNSTSDEPQPSAADNDVLKRLMQKRKAEVKNESE